MENSDNVITLSKELKVNLEQTVDNEDNVEVKNGVLNIYEVKFICRDDYQYTGEDITNYNDYINPLGKAVYIHAKNASEALDIAIDEILKIEINNGYEIADIHGNYLLLMNFVYSYI